MRSQPADNQASFLPLMLCYTYRTTCGPLQDKEPCRQTWSPSRHTRFQFTPLPTAALAQPLEPRHARHCIKSRKTTGLGGRLCRSWKCAWCYLGRKYQVPGYPWHSVERREQKLSRKQPWPYRLLLPWGGLRASMGSPKSRTQGKCLLCQI